MHKAKGKRLPLWKVLLIALAAIFCVAGMPTTVRAAEATGEQNAAAAETISETTGSETEDASDESVGIADEAVPENPAAVDPEENPEAEEAGIESDTESLQNEAADQLSADGSEEEDPFPAEIDPEKLLQYVPASTEEDNDAEFREYADRVFNEELGKSYTAYNTNRSDKLTSSYRAVYNIVYNAFHDIANGNRSVTYIDIPYSSVGLSWSQIGYDVNYSSTDLWSVVDCLLTDCPYDCYWFDKTFYNSSTGRNCVSVYQYGSYFRLYFVVAREYSSSGRTGTYYVNTSKTGATRRAAANAKQIADSAKEYSIYNALSYFNDRICDLTDYNYNAVYSNADYGNPWQLIWVFDNDPSTKVVCEGYAKAFKYLCDLWGLKNGRVDCYLATGWVGTYSNGGAHMWNVVAMPDGNNYLVDCTSNDGRDHKTYFLKGSTNTRSGYYHSSYRQTGYTVSDTPYTYYDEYYGSSSECMDQFTDSEIRLASHDYTPSSGNEAQVRNFVTRLYRYCLNREPDTAGLNSWTNNLVLGRITGVKAAEGFFLSREMMNRHLSNAEYVNIAYRVFLNRSADAAGRQNWVDRLNAGMSYKAIVAGFGNSNEFSNICSSYGITRGTYTSDAYRDQNYGVTQFVGRLYTQALGRRYDTSGLESWCKVIITSSNRKQKAIQTASNFFNSREFQNRRLNNTAYVQTLYRTFLNREADSAGLNSWVSQLNRGVSRQSVLNGFANSREFSNLMASYGIR